MMTMFATVRWSRASMAFVVVFLYSMVSGGRYLFVLLILLNVHHCLNFNYVIYSHDDTFRINYLSVKANYYTLNVFSSYFLLTFFRDRFGIKFFNNQYTFF